MFRSGDGYDPTRVFSPQLELVQDMDITVGGDRHLEAALPGGRQVYRQQRDDTWQAVVYRGQQHLLTLRPPGQRRWTWGLSVFGHPTSGQIVVSDYKTKCIDVFSSDGE